MFAFDTRIKLYSAVENGQGRNRQERRKNMKGWMTPALMALLLWGFWGFLPKIATRYVDPRSALVFQTFGCLLVGLVAAIGAFPHLQFQTSGIIWSVLAGIFGMVGSLFYLIAVSRGKVSVIVTVTALYPLFSILLAVSILKEPLTIRHGLGFICAIGAIILFSF